MNFGFNFEWPPFVGSVIGILASAVMVAGAVAGAILLVRRVILAWRKWGQPQVLVPFANRVDLLNGEIALIGLKEGKRIGRVKDVILNLQTGCVAGFRVRAHWRKWVLPFERVKSIGREAITVESADDLQQPDSLPALTALAATKYRWDNCEVMTETGLRLGTTSWRELWYNRTEGSVDLAIQTSHHSLINTLLAWAIELASVWQPLDNWIDSPSKLHVRVPLRALRSASRKMVILNREGETAFQQAVQAQATQIRESLNRFHGTLNTLLRWRERRFPAPPADSNPPRPEAAKPS